MSDEHEHEHGPGCGHTAVHHGDHVDHLHDGELHHHHEEGEVHRHAFAVGEQNPGRLHA